MASQVQQPTLAEHLCMTQIGGIVQKKFLGGYEVPLLQFLTIGQWLFLKGVVFGRARRNSLKVIAKMFVGLESLTNTFDQSGVSGQKAAKREDWVAEYLTKVADDGMAYYQKCYRKKPKSFLDLWLTSFVPPEADFRDEQKMRELAKRKIRLGVALQQADTWLSAGIGFGATFPELTERMWRAEYEKHNPDAWASARRHGLDIPEKFISLPLEEMEQQVLIEVASYATEYYPPLVDRLNLRLL